MLDFFLRTLWQIVADNHVRSLFPWFMIRLYAGNVMAMTKWCTNHPELVWSNQNTANQKVVAPPVEGWVESRMALGSNPSGGKNIEGVLVGEGAWKPSWQCRGTFQQGTEQTIAHTVLQWAGKSVGAGIGSSIFPMTLKGIQASRKWNEYVFCIVKLCLEYFTEPPFANLHKDKQIKISGSAKRPWKHARVMLGHVAMVNI